MNAHYSDEQRLRDEQDWLDSQRFAMGRLNLLVGEPGIGKSFLTHDLAARVSRVGGVSLIITGEDKPGDTIAPHLRRMNVDMESVHVLDGTQTNFSLDDDLDMLRNSLLGLDYLALVIIDPISAFMTHTDESNNAQVRSLLARLEQLAHDTGAAIINVTHLSKFDEVSGNGTCKVIGANAFTSASRTVQVVSQSGALSKRRVRMVKNDLGDLQPDRWFTIKDNELIWTSREADSGAQRRPSVRYRTDTNKADQAIWLLECKLRDGACPSKELHQAAREQGLSKNTLERAKAEMGLRSFRKGNRWYWARPSDEHG